MTEIWMERESQRWICIGTIASQELAESQKVALERLIPSKNFEVRPCNLPLI